MISNISYFDIKCGEKSVVNQKQELAKQAMRKSIEIRTQAGLDLKSPICIYNLCDKLNIKVRFVNISMEGMYLKENEPQILLSALRPLTRRNFTCAHELGHHVFGHSSTIDELIKDSEKSKPFYPDEFLVDCFAGFLLMPTLGIRKAFTSRGWDISSVTPLQIFTVACSFGVGYETLINHMTYSLTIINRTQADLLLKFTPKSIRQEVIGFSSTEPLIIGDKDWSMTTLDAEVGSYLLLPSTAEATNGTINFKENRLQGRLFRANRPGIVRVYCPDADWAVLVRISRDQFVGLSQYRHLEEPEDE
ncbi:ImmA/IrrE family metallo-endopeptidase [Dolichospermum sp. UHCC 0684]|uniref:ImmA/IrrE family metallo-endopeptidase n=1 Tax=unclassified Dolichospermum TaxID=2622029 RepID=UPI001C2C909B|nr:ImmA/IrrE family metallo-endopeptidase [Dolichospermum sp. UHCC 0684]MEA5531061.1 ImmA/IrrE family metallo-endopeptidase [Dolichospermum sp. UHCC 0684]